MRVAVRRHAPSDPHPATVRTPDFTLSFVERQAFRGDQPLRLTPTEWSLLERLAERPGHLVTQAELLRTVWGPGYDKETHYLRVYAAQLRRKLEPQPAQPRYLVTEPGQGYRLVLPD